MAVLLALLLTAILVFVDCKVYERCELARELKHVHEFPDEQIATWVCIAKHESTFNTSAINQGSGDHGLFQISDLFWCSPPGNGRACNVPCSAFEDDDITDDLACIKRIFKEHTFLSGNGFNAWTVYPLYCKRDVSKYVDGCFDNEIDNNINHGSTSQPPEPDDEESVYEFPPLPVPPKKAKSEEDESVYEFPPLPTIYKSDKSFSTVSSYQPVTTRKPLELQLPNRFSTVDKVFTTVKPFTISQFFTTPKSLKISQPLTTPKAFTTAKSHTTFKSLNTLKQFGVSKLSTTSKSAYTFKPFTSFKQALPVKTTPRPYFTTSRITNSSKRPYSIYSTLTPTTSRPSLFRKSLVPKPLSILFENIHSDHKREQKFYGADNSEYSFLWKSNGAPVLLSFPHLLYGHKEYLATVEGLHPNETLHETFVILEPISGAPLKVAKRVQFNMFIRAVEDIVSIENVTNALVPIFWIEESMTLEDKYVDIIKNTLLNNLKILEIIKWALIGVGAAAVVLPIALIIYKN